MSFDEVRRNWTRLGEQDPLWAVYVAPDKRGNRWDTDEFLALGKPAVANTRDWFGRIGLPTTWSRVLDFGCGAGRLSQALAAHADSVVGVDVSAPMLKTARELDRTDGKCEFVLNEAPDLKRFADGSFDLVYTELVLQHLPANVIEGYLAEFMRVLRPGGSAMIHCTTRPLWTFKGAVWRIAPQAVVGWAQRKLLDYPAPMLMTPMATDRVTAIIEAGGGRVVATQTEDDPATHWRAHRYAITKDA
ncbi:MAG TPA: class I SAM-dependent methyltransferase [Actinokineospora sp.]|jgi:SAM-dependent methyltransferase|nr:class I SAM-dependent methyltransferase [Actinokineospora sp.]